MKFNFFHNVTKYFLSALVFAALFLLITGSLARAQEPDPEKLKKLADEISQYETELSKLKGQAGTLSNQIAQFDAQIRLTTLRVNQTEEKITLLGGRIGQLQTSLESLSKAFSTRVAYSYKMSRIHEPFLMLITSPNLSSAFSSYEYLKRIEEADRSLLVRLQDAQVSYVEQKKDQEVLQKQLEDQKATLNSQKTAKNALLIQTKNDEKKYQSLLASAKSEFEAIQAIVAGKGQETPSGKVSEGQRIASIIQGPSCNSSGSHLHFMVAENGNTLNPFSYLKSGIAFNNDSGGDPFNPSGGWEWPIAAPIDYNQGYGVTWCVKYGTCGRIYSMHNGIDIMSPNSEVKAVKSGSLFRGSYTGSSGCRLRYVRVDHDDSSYDTFYLHINY